MLLHSWTMQPSCLDANALLKIEMLKSRLYVLVQYVGIGIYIYQEYNLLLK